VGGDGADVAQSGGNGGVTMRIDLSEMVGTEVLALLTKAGHQAYVVGGPVRNALLGVDVSDLDVATDARPERVMALAKTAGLKAVPTGIDHGTVTVVIAGIGVEVTTFRRDVATDGRRAVVAFSDNIEDDARRRDFTINALYADANGDVLDPLGGLADLRARRVRFIDDASQRIREDYLRILRFFRFFAWYGDQAEGLDPDGLAACAELADGIEVLSKERIGAEMLKLLGAPDPVQAVAAMAQSGVLMRVLPGASVGVLAVLVQLEAEHNVAPDPLRRLAALGGVEIGKLFRLSKKQIIGLHTMRCELKSTRFAHHLGYLYGLKRARDIIFLRAAAFEQPVCQEDLVKVALGASSKFPLRAADLPHLKGPVLGKALKAAEGEWIASEFTLPKDALIAKSR
jgi:poly(A) polymerase